MGLRTAIAIFLLLGGSSGTTAQGAQPTQQHPPTQQERDRARAALDAFTSPTLTRFRDEAEFRRYIKAVHEAEDYEISSAAAPGPVTTAQATAAPAPGQPATQSDQIVCPDGTPPPCVGQSGNAAPDDQGQPVVITGSRIPAPRNPSITNNQMRNVEEGDIVKQIDHYLLVLQDGRIFVVDIQAGGVGRRPGQGLRLTDRANVYRYVSHNTYSEVWYDEMLVSSDRILVTGYSYDAQASELAVFRLDTRTGRLRREGVFRIASNDYYSSRNYATRLIGDNLVVYTPFEIAEIGDDDFVWPRVRPWGPADDAREQAWLERRARDYRTPREPLPDTGAAMLDGGDIYRPVERFAEPTVHTVAVCPLATAGRGRLACHSTAMVGPAIREWYVTTDYAFLWSGDAGNYCDDDARRAPPTIAEARRALVYRVPINGAAPTVAGARGAPPDQFAMQADARNLYALVRLERTDCRPAYSDPARLAFATVPHTAFSATRAELPPSAFVDLPGTPTPQVAARFTERYLVYGGLSGYRRRLPDPNEFVQYGYNEDPYLARRFVGMRAVPATIVPVAHPDRFRTLATGQTVIRAERLGNDILLTGYRDRGGLSVTLVGLSGTPRIASSITLPGRYESEGRSHAFNSRTDPDGSSLMGLPTVPLVKDSDRQAWRSRASDLSYLAADRQGRLRPIGELVRRFDYVDNYDETSQTEDEDGVPGYQCEVSCIDWYGNSRPIFTDGRIFGLTGTELIEGRLVGGRISETARLNIALSPVPAR